MAGFKPFIMLIELTIQHFVLIEQLCLSFEAGMTVLTGETGAGKSILCDALALALGGRVNTSFIQVGQPNCRISAQFTIQALPVVQAWLAQHRLSGSSHHYCCLERLIPRVGRAQASINGYAVSAQSLRELGALLVTIEGQQAHQSLLQQTHQRALLDRYGDNLALLEAVQAHWLRADQLRRQCQTLSADIARQKTQRALLSYQQHELQNLALQPEEFTQLDREQRQLAYAQQMLTQGQSVLTLMSETETVPLMGSLHTAQQHLKKMAALDSRFEPVLSGIEQATIQLEEAQTTLRHTLDHVILDPERLAQVEQRLSQICTLARKHGVKPEDLTLLAAQLQQEWEQLAQLEQALRKCEHQREQCWIAYQSAAHALSHQRAQTATKLQALVTEKIQSLGMTGGQFEIRLVPLDAQQPNRWGNEHIEFYFSAAPGQNLQPLAKCASGGELSRIYLAFQALIADSTPVSTLIFDEVDTGISGGTAEVVGRLLQQLSLRRQVLCITHLPQIAALGQQHYQISKVTHDQTTQTHVSPLKNQAARVQEIARMLGGLHITPQTIAHAQEMLKSV